MNSALDFAQPWTLLLLPLAVLPTGTKPALANSGNALFAEYRTVPAS